MSSYISTMSVNSNIEPGFNTTRNYICPKCNRNYDFQLAGNNFVGRIPLILNCKHTICQECVHKMYPSKDIICAECRTSNYISDIEAKKKADHVFTVNFYVFGALAYHKRYSCESPINFKPAGFQFRQASHNNNRQDVKPNSFLSFNASPTQQNFNQFAHLRPDIPQHVCSQELCNKEAKLNCADCDELYCTQCSDTIHNQAKGLKKHKVTPLSSGDCLELTDICPTHQDALLEFLCTTCDKNLCCYCILSDHQGHAFHQLTQLKNGNIDEFKSLVENAEEVLRRLMISEEKIRRLLQKTPKPATPDNTVELLISKKIKNAIAKLQMLEKDLLTQMQKIRNQDKISLTTVQEQLIVNIRSVSNLINVSKQATDSRCSPKKLNIHLLKKQLEGVGNTPCYFLQNDKENADLEFLFEDTLIEDLQHSARLNFTESNPYSLVTRQELPPDYEDDETISIAKSVLSSASSLIDSIDSRSVREKAVPRKAAKSDHVEKWLQSTTPSGLNQQQHQQGKRLFPIKDIRDQHVEMPTFQKGDRETVKVTHLMSPECFYVQLGRMSGPLMRLSKTIDKHIRSKSVIIVQAPDINDLYLVKYMSDGQTHWCRGRVVEYLPEQKMYNVYFIDYGNTATVKREEIAMIPPDLKRLIPFAVKCKFFDLYPAKGGVWDSKAVYTMAKIIANNELLMIITEVSPDCLEVDLLTTDCDTSLRDALKFLGYGIPYCKYPTDLDNIKKQLKNTETLKLYANNDQFKKEESLDVIISYAINPYNIYINLKNSRNDLMKLHENMDNFYRDNKKGYIYSPREDMVVAVLYSDTISSSWRRGIITQSTEGRGMVTVKLVDIGMTISVAWDQVRKLDGRFAAQYCQAKLVKMAHVKPPNGADFWPPNAVDFFTKFIKTEATLKMVVNDVGIPPEVVFFECFPSVHNCLNAMLVKSDFAESTGDLSSTVEWPQFSYEPKKEDDSFTISMLKTIQTTNHHLQDTAAKDDVDSDDEEVTENIYRKPIEVISAESPDVIYVTFTDNKQKLHEFQLELKHFYTKTKLQPAEWAVGDPCVVYHRKRYYRGIVSEILSNEKCLVSLSDYATNVEVKTKQLGILDERFTKDPQFAIRCHLADVLPAGGTGKWSGMACEFLQDILKNNTSLYLARKGELDKERKSMPVLIWYTEFLPGGALESSKTILHLVNKLLLKNGLALKPAVPKLAEDDAQIVHEKKDRRDSMKSASTETEDHECSSSVSSNSVAGALKPSTSKIDWNDLIEMQKQCPEQIIRDWMPPLPFAENEFKAIPTFVNDHGEIFLHDMEKERLLKEMEENMDQYFQPTSDFEVGTVWLPGEMCSVRYFVNRKWYRGRVLAVSDSSIKVVMVDYGNEDDCDPLDLSKEILFYDIPIIANKIVLDGVFPRENQWLTSDLDLLHAQIVDKHVRVKLVAPEIAGVPTPAVVKLGNLNVNDFIIENSKNLSKINRPKPLQQTSCNSDVLLPLNDTLDGVNSLSDNDVIIDESASSSDEVLAKNPVILEEEPHSPIISIGMIELNYKQSPLPEIKSGEKFEIVIINVPDYNKIVFELPASEHFEKSKELFEDMSKEINFLLPEQKPLKTFEEGHVCIALFPEDNQWYRAQIVKELNADEVYVWFVDFGNFESLKKTDVKELRDCWLEIPVDQHLATIYAIKIVEEKNHHEVLNEMVSYCEACQLAKIVLDKPLSLELYKKDASDVLSYQNLIDGGLLEIVKDELQGENEVKEIQISM